MKLIIVSSASPGVEQGALQAAIDLGFDIGGWRAADSDVPPIFATLRVTSGDRGMVRRLNVQDSDGTLALGNAIAPVGVVAFCDRVTDQQGKPFMSVVLGRELPDSVRTDVIEWLTANDISTLYVAGPGEDDEPGVQAAARKALVWILEGVATEQLRAFVGAEMKLLENLVDLAPVSKPSAEPGAA